MQTLTCLDCGRDSGAYRLWVTITLDAVETLKASGGRDKLASSFLFDDNPFLVGVCNVLDIDVDTFREKLQTVISKSLDFKRAA